MQRYVASCCTVFMHKQARLSISRCKHVCRVISPETIGATRLRERCWSLPVRCCCVIRLQQAFPSNRGSEPREPHPGLSKPLLQPAALRGGRARGGKRGQASPEATPNMSSRLASHLGRDVGAGVAATLRQRQKQKQGDPEDTAKPCPQGQSPGRASAKHPLSAVCGR